MKSIRPVVGFFVVFLSIQFIAFFSMPHVAPLLVPLAEIILVLVCLVEVLIVGLFILTTRAGEGK